MSIIKIAGGAAATVVGGFTGLVALGMAITTLPTELENSQSVTEAVVQEWIDGDTVDTDHGRVRLIGMDAADAKRCPDVKEQARARAAALAPAGDVVYLVLPAGVDNTGKHGRLLRYVETKSTVDVGGELINNDLADARYDSQDGYDFHPFEPDYRAADTPGSVNDKGLAACPVPVNEDEEDEAEEREEDSTRADEAALLAAKKAAEKEEKEEKAKEAEAAKKAAEKAARTDMHGNVRSSAEMVEVYNAEFIRRGDRNEDGEIGRWESFWHNEDLSQHMAEKAVESAERNARWAKERAEEEAAAAERKAKWEKRKKKIAKREKWEKNYPIPAIRDNADRAAYNYFKRSEMSNVWEFYGRESSDGETNHQRYRRYYLDGEITLEGRWASSGSGSGSVSSENGRYCHGRFCVG